MRASIKHKKESANIEITDLYALKFSALWAALKSENLSLLMLCLYFLFEYVRPQALYPALDILPWGELFLLASVAFGFMDKTAIWVGNIQNTWFIVFTVIIILSGAFAFRPAASLENWTTFGTWFIMYFLVISIVNTEQRLILFLLAYCLFSFKMSQHGAIAWTRRGFSFSSYGLIGSPGWFRNSGEYAIQMLIYGSLAISMVVSLKDYWGRYKKWIFYIFAATGYMSVIGASSRGSQLALLAIGVWFLLKQKNGFKGLLVMLAMAAVLFYFLPDEQMQRFKEMGDDSNSLQRLAYWEYGLSNVIPKFPVLGVGYNNWLSYLYYSVPEGLGPYQTVQEPHNIYIKAAAELGLIGLVVFIVLIFYAFVNNIRTRRMAKTIGSKFFYNLSFGLDAGLIGYLIAGNFVTVLFYPFFWVQIAMIVMLNNITNKQFSEKSSLSGRSEVVKYK